jgi:hypothetical protein
MVVIGYAILMNYQRAMSIDGRKITLKVFKLTQSIMLSSKIGEYNIYITSIQK